MAESFITFAAEIIRKPGEVGAIAPSSKYLGFEISKYIESPLNKPINVIEVGPGTGAFTKIIADKLKETDHLDVIEYNPQFVEVLKDKMKSYKNVDVHCVSITDWQPEYKYDFMVSSLPFNVFDEHFVKKILEHYEDIMKPDSRVSYFEYMFFPKLKKQLLSGEKKEEFINLHKVLNEFKEKYEIGLGKVFKNFPPAYVHHLKMKKA